MSRTNSTTLPALLLLITITCFLPTFDFFNLSPTPNIFIKKPPLSSFQEQSRSSYFGYSLNLRRNHVLVGAPRAQSTLEQQRKVNETGAIYKCNLENDAQPCHPYHFDTNGNTHVENVDLAYNSEKKDFQLLGFAMDGQGSENDRFVVCAPKLMADLEESDHYLLHGVCYWTASTNSTQPSGVRSIIPLRQRNLQTLPGPNKTNYYYYIYGESGFSVHITENDEEIIVGCPGILNWKGSIIRYRAGKRVDLGGLSRRDLAQDGRARISHILRKRQTMEYRSEVPNPFYASLSDDSYFGYAVSSAYFLGKAMERLYYVASAPQADHQTGEVYIFDIEDFVTEKKIKVFNKFNGSQFGEYFGYTLLCEDFNSDGLPDLAVSAPLHSKNGEYEHGAVYIFINIGNLAFEQQALLTSDYESNGRFGTSLSKIGDLNLDGYNDLVVSAPFEGDNGAIYVYLGGPDGVALKPSQRIGAPSELPNAFGDKSNMFGHGLSRGVDIDGNRYNDIAVGSPGSETVYVFRAYPVVKVIASITPSKSELTIDDNVVAIKVCSRYESVTPLQMEIDFAATISLDMKYNRASFFNNEIEKTINDTLRLSPAEKCNDYMIYVRASIADIFTPVVIEMKYEVVHKIPELESEFCEHCVAVDPRDAKMASTKIAFATGCAGEKCISDLSVIGTLANVRQPFILGSEKTIAIKYEVHNAGEAAYLTQLTVTIPGNLTSFSRIPSSCRQDSGNRDVMICDINAGKPVKNKETTDMTIMLDASRLEGTVLNVHAEVASAGEEQNDADNKYLNEILLAEFSDVELNGQSSATQLSLEDGLRIENLQYRYKIYNNGPSTIKELAVSIHIPLVHLPRANYHVPLVNFENIDIRGFYTNKVYEVTWNKDNKIWLQSRESENNDSNNNGVILSDNHHFDSSKLGFDYELNADKTEDFNTLGQSHHRRRRRSLWQQESGDDFNANGNVFRVYNQYTGSIDEYSASYRIATEVEDRTLMSLPRNRTIYADCSSPEAARDECIEAQFIIHNFRPGSEAISINLNFSLDLTHFDEIFNEKQNIFVFKTNAQFQRAGDEDFRTLKITARNPYTIVYEKLTSKTPIWIWIVSSIVGLLVLILISYALYKLGFFNRARKEELERLTRESQHITAEELTNLNA